MYPYKRLKINGKCIDEHRWVWEQANGTIPEGFEIHHKNRDTLDNRLENLELKEISLHRREHRLGNRICTVPGCGRHYESNGYCKKHYFRWKRTGDPLGLRGHSSTNPSMAV